MLFPPKAPMGLGQIDDPLILAPILHILMFIFPFMLKRLRLGTSWAHALKARDKLCARRRRIALSTM